MLPSGWPPVKLGQEIRVLSGPHAGVRRVAGYNNRGCVWIENPETKMHDVEVTGNYELAETA